MKDIRIISGKQIRPDFDITAALLGRQPAVSNQTELSALFRKFSLPVQMRIQPKAALLITKPSFWLPCQKDNAEADDCPLLYAILTIGESTGRLIKTYTDKQELLNASVIDAMADSCLFAFEKQLLPIIRQLCLEEGYGIAGRLEIPRDLPLEMQSEIFHALHADRTLGLSITSGSMLSPAKSMSLVFTLTRDLQKNHTEHNCEACTSQNCPLRNTRELLLRVKWRPNSKSSYETTEILCPPHSNLLEILQKHRIFLPAYCGGQGICKKCGVQVLRGNLPVTEGDRSAFSEAELDMGMRLSCLAILQEPLTIRIEDHLESDFKALGNSSDTPAPFRILSSYPKGDCGIAIDIGTTTLAFSLLDLHTGICLDTLTAVNSQRAFGADIISRIQASNEGKKDLLQKSIQKDLQKGISRLIRQNLTDFYRIRHIAIAANTVMLHLLRGYSCEGFAKHPFQAKTLALEELDFETVFGKSEELSGSPTVTLLPGISPFVGADITAGLYACHILSESAEPVLFLDLGTNGEMALWKDRRLFVTSTAAGPAFEGGNIKWGMGSVPGAISNVTIEKGVPFVQTIGDRKPKGICGTGVIETTAELLSAKIMDKTGKLKDAYFKEGYPLAQTEASAWIRFTKQDIREIQMAKAAIRAGMETLLFRADTSYDEIGKVYLAGGFGYYLNIEKAAAIGLLPKELLSKTVLEGNTSLKGALLYLAEQPKEFLSQIQQSAEEISLANDPQFMDLYLNYMAF